MTKKEINKEFVNMRVIRKCIMKAIPKESTFEDIKKEIDSRYVKLVSVEKNCITFKANKKFREKQSIDSSFGENYINKFLADCFNNILNRDDITKKTLEISSDILIDDNNIIVEFNE